MKPIRPSFSIRRAGAYQAYYENMPLRHTSLPRGPKMQMYRKQSFGRLAEFLVLDGRQYRTPQPNDDKASDINEAALLAEKHDAGQAAIWLAEGFTCAVRRRLGTCLPTRSSWRSIDMKEGPEREFPMDEWCGYVHERNELMKFIQERKIANTVVLTGDNHANWVNDLRLDDLRPETPSSPPNLSARASPAAATAASDRTGRKR